jgi:hypothetical protein
MAYPNGAGRRLIERDVAPSIGRNGREAKLWILMPSWMPGRPKMPRLPANNDERWWVASRRVQNLPCEAQANF